MTATGINKRSLTMKECIISGWIHLAIGLAIGWLVFKRPDWITLAFQKIKQRIVNR